MCSNSLRRRWYTYFKKIIVPRQPLFNIMCEINLYNCKCLESRGLNKIVLYDVVGCLKFINPIDRLHARNGLVERNNFVLQALMQIYYFMSAFSCAILHVLCHLLINKNTYNEGTNTMTGGSPLLYHSPPSTCCDNCERCVLGDDK